MALRINIDEFFYLSTLENRAGLNMYRKTGITNKQVQILYGFATYMLLMDRKSVGFASYCQWCGAGPAMVRILQSQLKGLIENGAIHEIAYKKNPKKFLTYSISEFGTRLLEIYQNELEAVNSKYVDRNLKAGYKSLKIHSSKLEETLPMYIVGTRGRDE
jgi:hypothetical protein